MYLGDGAHAGDGSDVVGDGDEGGLRQVLLAHLLPSLLAHHVTKAAHTHTRRCRLNQPGFVQCTHKMEIWRSK